MGPATLSSNPHLPSFLKFQGREKPLRSSAAGLPARPLVKSKTSWGHFPNSVAGPLTATCSWLLPINNAFIGGRSHPSWARGSLYGSLQRQNPIHSGRKSRHKWPADSVLITRPIRKPSVSYDRRQESAISSALDRLSSWMDLPNPPRLYRCIVQYSLAPVPIAGAGTDDGSCGSLKGIGAMFLLAADGACMVHHVVLPVVFSVYFRPFPPSLSSISTSLLGGAALPPVYAWSSNVRSQH